MIPVLMVLGFAVAVKLGMNVYDAEAEYRRELGMVTIRFERMAREIEGGGR